LLVEDNPVNQRLAELVLQDTGCTIQFAENGHDAIELIRSDGFDLVFMDVQMPVLDGLTATRMIRSFNTSIPVVGLSANVYKEDVEACIQAGMTNFLAKPYTREKFLAMVAQYVPQTATIHYSNIIPGNSKPKKAAVIALNYASSNINFDFIRSLFGSDEESRQAFMVSIRDSFMDFITLSEDLNHHSWNGERKMLTMRSLHKIKPNFEMIGVADWGKRAEILEKDLQGSFNEKVLNDLGDLRKLLLEASNMLSCALVEEK
jgi:CheY-like chemotaxis protein